MPDSAVPAVLGVWSHLGSDGLNPLRQHGRRDGGRPAAGGEQHREYRAVHVVQRVPGVVDERLLVPGHPGQHPGLQQQPGHRGHVRPFLPGLQGERDPRRGQIIVARKAEDPVHQPAQRHLAFRALQGGERQARQHITAAAERLFTEHRTAAPVALVRRNLAQPGHAVVRLNRPAGFPAEPLAEPPGVPTNLGECLAVLLLGGKQRAAEQGTHRAAPLLSLLRLQHIGERPGHATSCSALAGATPTAPRSAQSVIVSS